LSFCQDLGVTVGGVIDEKEPAIASEATSFVQAIVSPNFDIGNQMPVTGKIAAPIEEPSKPEH
jgi:hypothetical protein